MPKVEIVQMGPLPHDLNLKAVAKTANRVQHHFQCVVGDPINNLGEPNAAGEYKLANLAVLLEGRRHQSGSEFEIGVTDSPLCEELFSGVDSESKNVVISLAPMEDLLPKINKSKADYVLLETAAQLLTIDFRRQTNLVVDPEVCDLPWHKETRSCVFDYCDCPPHTLKKLMAPKLCSQCQSLLESANIRESVITACINLVKKAVYAKVINVLRGFLSDPIGRALFGGVFLFVIVEILSKVGLSRLKIGLLILIVFAAVIIKNLLRSRQEVL